MANSKFVYVTFIETSPEKLWAALTDTEFMKKYWFGATVSSDWSVGSPWKITMADGRVADTGTITEFKPHERIAIKWQNDFIPEAKAEGYSNCLMELEAVDNVTKLTITHSIEVENSKFIAAVSNGWPRILSNLKSLLETGHVILPGKK